MNLKILSFVALILIVSAGCKPRKPVPPAGNEEVQNMIQERLINAQEGDVIEIPEGTFYFSRSLSLDGVPNVTIRGAGMEKTILSFINQVSGAEGLLIKADGITLEDFTVQDSKGDAIKITNSTDVVMRRVYTTWTNGAKEENGAYGLYTVGCTNVLMEECKASFASDAGIYVGQSNNVVMRNNYAFNNVAGIEIENCRNVEAYDNKAENNTGGFLIFDMPNLPQPNGYNVRAYNNEVIENNHRNFAPEGGIVHILPPGTGMLIVGHRDIELFNNRIIGHKTIGLGIVSFVFTQRPWEDDGEYSPYCSAIHVYDNTFERKKAVPDLTREMGQMLNAIVGPKPQDIIIDGIYDPEMVNENYELTGDDRICIRNNGEDLRFLNLNAKDAEGLKDLKRALDKEMSRFDCSLPPIKVENLEGIL